MERGFQDRRIKLVFGRSTGMLFRGSSRVSIHVSRLMAQVVEVVVEMNS